MSEELARRFHEVYERLAPSYGYETRTDTRAFDPTSANGQLMIAVCAEVLGGLERELAEARGLLTNCRGEIAYQDRLLTKLCPVEGPMAKSPHPALAEIDAFLAGEKP